MVAGSALVLIRGREAERLASSRAARHPVAAHRAWARRECACPGSRLTERLIGKHQVCPNGVGITDDPHVRSELPSGTVTFLFTDIEGSTRLVEALGSGYVELLAEHRRLIVTPFSGEVVSSSAHRVMPSSSRSPIRKTLWSLPRTRSRRSPRAPRGCGWGYIRAIRCSPTRDTRG